MQLTSVPQAPGKKVCIFGLGQLGNDLHTVLLKAGWEVAAFTKSGCDITNHEQTLSVLKQEKPAVIINCAAVHSLPHCEAFPDESYAVNVNGSSRLAWMATCLGAKLIYISTDQVFDGSSIRPYVESDRVHPLNVYAKHKTIGERISASCLDSFVIRTGCIFGGKEGARQKGGNFVTKLLKAEGPVKMTTRGQINATWTKDLAVAIESLMRSKAPSGVYHLAAQGGATWYELAKEVIGESRLVETSEDPSGINRPEYSVLDCSKAASWGVILPKWQDSVKGYLDDLRNRLEL